MGLGDIRDRRKGATQDDSLSRSCCALSSECKNQQKMSTSKKPGTLTPDLYCRCKQSHSINGRVAALPLHALSVHTKLLHASGQAFSHLQLLQQIPWNFEYKLNPENAIAKIQLTCRHSFS